MKKQFTEEQIIQILNEAKADFSREGVVSETPYFPCDVLNRRKKHGGLEISEAIVSKALNKKTLSSENHLPNSC